MKKILLLLLSSFLIAPHLGAQTEPLAGKWKTWFIPSGQDLRLPAPPNAATTKEEGKAILALQRPIDAATRQQIRYWNAGPPSYRWTDVVPSLVASDTTLPLMFVLTLFDVAVYDATIAAWDTKYAYNRLRPFVQDSRIKSMIIKPDSPSYPCENSVVAGVAYGLVSHFNPLQADSILKLAQQAMQARVAAGVQYPSDTKAGFELGKKVAAIVIEKTKGYVPATKWGGKMPSQPGVWKGKKPYGPLIGTWKTFVLSSGSQFRPPPPPDYKKDMEELKKFKPTFQATANAFFYATHSYWFDLEEKKVFENNIHLNPPRVARIFALTSVADYDGTIACWDAKYAYWGTRPDQYDPTYRPLLLNTPPHPGYPSGHAARSGTLATLFTYFFPEEKDFFWQKAKEAAESRFEGGIHFRTDNEVGLDLGKKVAELVIQRAKTDGADGP